VLIVEDEALIGMMLEEMLLDAGCKIAGNAHTLKGALSLAETADFDLVERDIPHQARVMMEPEHERVRVSFSDANDADAFRERFGARLN
jgi:AmiR/NasT family two-component response regulator